MTSGSSLRKRVTKGSAKIVPTTEDIECANRVAEVVKECIEYADGDSQLFTNELNRRTVDVALPRTKH